MRDLDRIKEVREFRVTGPQLTSLLLSTLVLASAVFAIGFQLGHLRSPVDLALFEPLGESDQDATSLLAAMLAEKEGRTLASTAPTTGALATDERAGSEASEPAAALSASDVRDAEVEAERYAAEEAEAERIEAERIEAEEAEAERLAALAELEAERAAEERRRVVEVVERSFPEGTEPAPELATVTAAPPVAPTLPAPPAGRGYTVQVGAFESIDDAAATIARLRSKGLEAFHVSATVNGTVYHRVRVGLYATQAEATTAAAKLEGATAHGTYVTEQP